MGASGESKSSKIEGLGFVEPLSSGVVASSGSQSSKIEGLGFSKPLLKGAVASGGSKPSIIEGLGFFKPLLRVVGRNPQKMKVLRNNSYQQSQLATLFAVNLMFFFTHKDAKCSIYDARSADLVPQASQSVPLTP